MKHWQKLLVWLAIVAAVLVFRAFIPSPPGILPITLPLFLYRLVDLVGSIALIAAVFTIAAMIRDGRQKSKTH